MSSSSGAEIPEDQIKTDESSVSGQLREVDSFFLKLAKSVTEIESEIKEALELEKSAMKQMIIKQINSSFPNLQLYANESLNCRKLFLEKRISDLADKVAELKQLTTARLLPANSGAPAGYLRDYVYDYFPNYNIYISEKEDLLKHTLDLQDGKIIAQFSKMFKDVSIVDKEVSVLVKELINRRGDILDNCINKLEGFLCKYYDHFLEMHHYGNHVKKDIPDICFVSLMLPDEANVLLEQLIQEEKAALIAALQQKVKELFLMDLDYMHKFFTNRMYSVNNKWPDYCSRTSIDWKVYDNFKSQRNSIAEKYGKELDAMNRAIKEFDEEMEVALGIETFSWTDEF
ncbi:hypothetical protein M0R45_010230 [Rubus argutus]|uniref:Uncharacterized protein n=1 Tax=Rubus argutus TaxID=59490 RepID=A0AAW1Y9D5_RUBAR